MVVCDEVDELEVIDDMYYLYVEYIKVNEQQQLLDEQDEQLEVVIRHIVQQVTEVLEQYESLNQ